MAHCGNWALSIALIFAGTGFFAAFGVGFFFLATDLDYPAFADTLMAKLESRPFSGLSVRPLRADGTSCKPLYHNYLIQFSSRSPIAYLATRALFQNWQPVRQRGRERAIPPNQKSLFFSYCFSTLPKPN